MDGITDGIISNNSGSNPMPVQFPSMSHGVSESTKSWQALVCLEIAPGLLLEKVQPVWGHGVALYGACRAFTEEFAAKNIVLRKLYVTLHAGILHL